MNDPFSFDDGPLSTNGSPPQQNMAANSGARAGGTSNPNAAVSARISRTEEQTSMMMQRFTAYVIEVNDFGRSFEVSHRYSEFEALYRSIQTDCLGVSLPPMPPKGTDGTDMAVVAQRKVELQKVLNFMLSNPEVVMEKQLHIWKFLNLANPTVIASRFVLAPRARATVLKTLTKLNDVKYKDDVFRLAHPSVTGLLLEACREFRNGDAGSGHWCWLGGRTAVCQLLAGALGHSESARTKMLEGDIIAVLLGVVERDEGALDDVRTALNVIVSREAERFSNVLAAFIGKGGMSQLAVLAQRPKNQEFVAKLLWLAWDAPARRPFAQPGQGIRLLQALIQSSTGSCALLGGVLLSGLVANGDLTEASHRSEALRMVRTVLANPNREAAADPQFAKTLCGANATLVRLAALLEDAETCPLILGLLCAAKPPAAKLGRLSGNLAGLVGDKGVARGEEIRARAAELLLHIQQGSGSAPLTSPLPTSSGGAASASASIDLDRCEGIAAHEESLEKAMRWQLEEALAKSRTAMESTSLEVRDLDALGQVRLQPLPNLSFANFETGLRGLKQARDDLQKHVSEGRTLHHDMERQLLELKSARPSSVDERSYKERLAAVERLYSEVKQHRESLATAETEARDAQNRSETSSNDLRRAADVLRRLEEEIGSLRLSKTDKETQAMKLRHKADTPGLENMKRNCAESLERNIQQAQELQRSGQRVQQGDPDYLGHGETREQKIAELTQKLGQLKKQHVQLQAQQKEYDFNPEALRTDAIRLETDVADAQSRIDAMEQRRHEVERERAEKMSSSTRDSEDTRRAQDRRGSLSSQLAGAESQLRSQMSSLQPMIQEHHSGWQRLIGQQKRLEGDHQNLDKRIAQAKRATEEEARQRQDLVRYVRDLTLNLQSFELFLDQVGAGVPAAAPAAAPGGIFDAPAAAAPPAGAPATRGGVFDDDADAFGFAAVPAAPAVETAPVSGPSTASLSTAPQAGVFDAPDVLDDVFDLSPKRAPSTPLAEVTTAADDAPPPLIAAPADDFDAFLKEDSSGSFGAAMPAAATPAPTLMAAESEPVDEL